TKADTKIIKEEKKKINLLKEEITQSYQTEEVVEKNNSTFVNGDNVSIKDSTTSGTIVEIEKNIITLDTGNIRIKANIKNIIHSKIKKENKEQNYFITEISSAKTKLDIRGWKPEEAEFEIIKFVDDAYLGNLKHIEIIHGKGKGVLRATVHEILKSHDLIGEFNLAKIEFGGDGVTTIRLKE
ncbi:MAG: Smr/MutS family protein, partial [Melioribacteraceae bacterium]